MRTFFIVYHHIPSQSFNANNIIIHYACSMYTYYSHNRTWTARNAEAINHHGNDEKSITTSTLNTKNHPTEGKLRSSANEKWWEKRQGKCNVSFRYTIWSHKKAKLTQTLLMAWIDWPPSFAYACLSCAKREWFVDTRRKSLHSPSLAQKLNFKGMKNCHSKWIETTTGRFHSTWLINIFFHFSIHSNQMTN